MAQPITKPQLKKLWAMARALGMDEVDLRGLVKNMTGSDHVSKITKAQASKVIELLSDRHNRRSRPEMASAQQVWKIKQLAKELGWEGNPKRLAGFIKRQTGVDNERWLNAAGAWKVIEGLKKMLERCGAKTGEV